MAEVRIYLKTEKYGPEQGLGTYYMTYKKDGEWKEPPATEQWLQMQNKRRKCLYVSRPCMEVIMLTNALRELKGKCTVEIFCETRQLIGYLQNWIPLWKERGWVDSKGEQIRKEYKNLAEELDKHEVRDITDGPHEYTTGLEAELHAAFQGK